MLNKLNDCIKKLNYYKLEDVLISCFWRSRELHNQINFKDNLFPWELETLVMLNIKAKHELDNEKFLDKHFAQMINIIRKSTPGKNKNLGGDEYVKLTLSAIALQQFEYQENKIIFLYRANYIFSHELFKDEFIKEYGHDYMHYCVLIYCIYIVINSKELDYEVQYDLFTYIYLNEKNVFDKLSITLKQFQDILDNCYSSVEDYYYGFCPLYSKPFLDLGKNLMIPLPHLLLRSVTTSMLFDFTKNDNERRRKLGTILEEYVYKLMDDSKIFSEIHKEKSFKTNQGTIRTRDVNALIDNKFLLIECKSHTPKLKLRSYSKEAYNKEVNDLAEYICKIYKDIIYTRSKYDEYNCFDTVDICTASINDIYSLMLILDDSIIMREDVYIEAAQRIGISQNEANYIWLTTHIKIMGYYEFEKILLTKQNPIDYVITLKPYDYTNSIKINEFVDNGFLTFNNELTNNIKNLLGKIFAS